MSTFEGLVDQEERKRASPFKKTKARESVLFVLFSLTLFSSLSLILVFSFSLNHVWDTVCGDEGLVAHAQKEGSNQFLVFDHDLVFLPLTSSQTGVRDVLVEFNLGKGGRTAGFRQQVFEQRKGDQPCVSLVEEAKDG